MRGGNGGGKEGRSVGGERVGLMGWICGDFVWNLFEVVLRGLQPPRKPPILRKEVVKMKQPKKFILVVILLILLFSSQGSLR